MTTRKKQLDPFDTSPQYWFETKEIRNSKSRESRRRLVPLGFLQEKDNSKKIVIVIVIITLLAVCGIGLVIWRGKSNTNVSNEENPLVNPAGREASSEYSVDGANNRELHATEQKKLNTANALALQEKWEAANALFETIFPAYLDTCEQYQYYSLAAILAANIDNFSIQNSTIGRRIDQLRQHCEI